MDRQLFIVRYYNAEGRIVGFRRVIAYSKWQALEDVVTTLRYYACLDAVRCQIIDLFGKDGFDIAM